MKQNNLNENRNNAINDLPLYLANESVFVNSNSNSNSKISVTDKYTNKVVAQVSAANKAIVDKAILAAQKAAPALRALSSFERRQILAHCIARLQERKEEFIDIICTEVGKSWKDAKGEVMRSIGTFVESMGEASRIYGEKIPLDISERGKDFQGFWKRVPIGPCLFITPFNFPLNLVVHKVAPAIAAGCPFILKPSSVTPLSSLLLGEILAETSLPKGSFSILPCDSTLASSLVEHPALKLLSFTGSAKVGWDLKSRAGKKAVVLELGGNAACIVDENVDLDDTVEKIARGAYYMSGQSCISVQRIFAHRSLYESLKNKLVEKINTFKMGNPKEHDTFIGPMISVDAAQRIEQWIKEACDNGAKLLCGGVRKEAFVTAALLENVAEDQKLNCEEAFGPVAIIAPFDDFTEALTKANNTRYGLQAGVFTRDLDRTMEAWDTLEVGGVIINDVSSWRSDNMPYGGVKDSGIGREGVRFAIEHLTEIRLMALHGKGLQVK